MYDEDQIQEVINTLREHSPDVLDETGDCSTCNGMIQLAKMIHKYP